MFARYVYKDNSNVVDIFSDIKKCIMAPTNSSLGGTLSSAVESVESEFITTQAGGWQYTPSDRYGATAKHTMPVGYASDIIWVGGAISLWVAAGANGIITSPNGISWTVRQSGMGFTALAFNGQVIIAIREGVANTAKDVWRSLDGLSWGHSVDSTLSVTGDKRCVAVHGITFCIMGDSNGAYSYTSTDGATWSFGSKPYGISDNSYTANAVTISPTQFVMVGVNCCAVSNDGLLWSTTYIPTGIYIDIAIASDVACAITTTHVAIAPVTLVGWNLTLAPHAFTSILASGGDIVASTGTGSAIYVSGDNGVSWVANNIASGITTYVVTSSAADSLALITASGLFFTAVKNSTSGIFKAVNKDGLSFKTVVVSVYAYMETGYIELNVCESATATSVINSCYGCTDFENSPRIDIVNGGALFIRANTECLFILSYLVNGGAWGTLNGASMVGPVEYTRRDVWSSANPSAWPTHGWYDFSQDTRLFVPKYKTGISSHVAGLQAQLIVRPTFETAYPTLDEVGGLVPIAIPIEAYYTDNDTHMGLGGTLLGGLNRINYGAGATLDEITFGLSKYFMVDAISYESSRALHAILKE